MSNNKSYVPTLDDFKLKGNDVTKQPDENFSSLSFRKEVFRRFIKRKGSVIGLIIIVLITLFAFVGPSMNAYTFSEQNLDQKNLAPRIPFLEGLGIFDGSETLSSTTGDYKVNYYKDKGLDDVAFWFGSDNFGRDIWTRTWIGAQVSLIIAVVAALIDMLIGMTYGLISGYFGGKVDMIMQRILEILNGIPRLVIVTLLLLVMKPGIFTIIVALMITEWIGMSRIARAEVIKIKEQEYVLASRAAGARGGWIIRKHLLPNCISVIIISTALQIPSAIFTESYLSFLGLGVNAPMPSLGSLASDALNGINSYAYRLVIPAIIISLIVLSLNLFGDGLRDAFDPKLRR